MCLLIRAYMLQFEVSTPVISSPIRKILPSPSPDFRITPKLTSALSHLLISHLQPCSNLRRPHICHLYPPKLMSVSQGIPIYGDINNWNQNIQSSSAIDPNTLPITPPHTHLQHSTTTDNMSIWEDDAINNEQTWDSPTHPKITVDNSPIAANFQGQEFSASMKTGIDGERHERQSRRPREYGTSLSSHSITPFLSPCCSI